MTPCFYKVGVLHMNTLGFDGDGSLTAEATRLIEPSKSLRVTRTDAET